MTTLQSGARALIARFAAEERGATAIEYAILAAGIGGTVATIVYSVGSSVKANLYDRIATIF
jgi:pilus assembly protein Flp/PilA